MASLAAEAAPTGRMLLRYVALGTEKFGGGGAGLWGGESGRDLS